MRIDIQKMTYNDPKRETAKLEDHIIKGKTYQWKQLIH